MSPANKFWLGVLLIVVFYMSFICIWIPIISYLFYSLIIGVIYVTESEYQSEEVNKEFRDKPWVRPTLFFIILYLITKFNDFLNNKFNKNDEI